MHLPPRTTLTHHAQPSPDKKEPNHLDTRQPPDMQVQRPSRLPVLFFVPWPPVTARRRPPRRLPAPCAHASVVVQTCGASLSSASATAACDSAVGVSASMRPPRPVPLILAPMAPALRAATTRVSSSSQDTVSSWQSTWFSSSSCPSVGRSPLSMASSPRVARATYRLSSASNQPGSASFLARTSPTTFDVLAVMPVLAYTMRIGVGIFFLTNKGAASVLWKRSTPPNVAAVLSMPDGVPW
mmetsp:Transcript_73476/g.163177  ORF Transcript_73476/g.163177 Transcript_73476/m.163177 type:complete len:241 (+) Transcript_73476:205-927(+)